MCSTIHYKMLVSHSPPVFSHSPPTSFLHDYGSLRRGTDTCARFAYRSASCSSLLLATKPSDDAPKRPCLVIRQDDASSSSDDDVATSPTRLKKRVVFADDRGMSLTHVRVMREPSNVPPLWSYKFLAEVTQGVFAEPEATKDQWEIRFAQPASDYVDFRKRLDTQKVSLENVIVRDVDSVVVGTVKVSNMAFQKEVMIRLTGNNWATSEDAYCNYVENSAPISGAYVLYDTFSFHVPLPPGAKQIEFCVCYRCDDREFWDSNNGKNYVIMKKIQSGASQKSLLSGDLNSGSNRPISRCRDIAETKLDSWSEFASWTHLENSHPYW